MGFIVPGPKRQISYWNVKTGWYNARQDTLPHFCPPKKEEKKEGECLALDGVNWIWRFGQSFDGLGRGQ